MTPDLIVTRYFTGERKGDDFIAAIRSDRRHEDVPIIVVTAIEERAFRLRALDAGATDLMIRPVDRPEFIARARNLLKMYRQSQLVNKRAASLLDSLRKRESILAWTQRENESRLVNVINTLPVMVSATDLDGCILFMNVNKATYLGLKSEDVVGKHCTDVFWCQMGQPEPHD